MGPIQTNKIGLIVKILILFIRLIEKKYLKKMDLESKKLTKYKRFWFKKILVEKPPSLESFLAMLKSL
ncbi:MAG: hypothetical protein Ct9H90mP6_05720 [Gammaproteobacteria bacterium]|nr:MAG: hypothetical protein Ct9H90mP6_05720 [Gammaproteobacteria bacterium]